MSAVVRIATGSISGTMEQGVHAFKGVPYAAPPVGRGRFRPPAPPAAWDGVRDASRYGPVSPQQVSPGVFGDLGTPPELAGDDALNLNVWTPDPGAGGLPVLVWIHGGGFYAGSGREDSYNGAAFARDGVVTVTFNYRLGAQGFWHLGEHFPALAESGNLGMLDQIAALEWVQENIGAFGGDPSKVTIAGESAGGMSVCTLLAMPRARHLFHRAIPQSGAGHNGVSAATAAMVAGYLLDLLGVRPGDIDALASVPSDVLLDAQIKLSDEMTQTRDPARFREAAASAMCFQPTYGTELLPERPIDAVASGASKDVALMVGTTKEEALIFVVTAKEMFSEGLAEEAAMESVFDAAALAVYTKNRPDAAPHELAAALLTDFRFTVPAIRLADAQVRHNADVWRYRFDWRTPVHGGAYGAHHFLEVPFVFDQLDNPQARGFAGDAPPRSLADATHAAWVAFATTGDPNNGALPEWPRYDPTTRPTMLLDESCRVERDPNADELALWDGVI